MSNPYLTWLSNEAPDYCTGIKEVNKTIKTSDPTKHQLLKTILHAVGSAFNEREKLQTDADLIAFLQSKNAGDIFPDIMSSKPGDILPFPNDAMEVEEEEEEKGDKKKKTASKRTKAQKTKNADAKPTKRQNKRPRKEEKEKEEEENGNGNEHDAEVEAEAEPAEEPQEEEEEQQQEEQQQQQEEEPSEDAMVEDPVDEKKKKRNRKRKNRQSRKAKAKAKRKEEDASNETKIEIPVDEVVEVKAENPQNETVFLQGMDEECMSVLEETYEAMSALNKQNDEFKEKHEARRPVAPPVNASKEAQAEYKKLHDQWEKSETEWRHHYITEYTTLQNRLLTGAYATYKCSLFPEKRLHRAADRSLVVHHEMEKGEEEAAPVLTEKDIKEKRQLLKYNIAPKAITILGLFLQNQLKSVAQDVSTILTWNGTKKRIGDSEGTTLLVPRSTATHKLVAPVVAHILNSKAITPFPDKYMDDTDRIFGSDRDTTINQIQDEQQVQAKKNKENREKKEKKKAEAAISV